MEFLKSKLGLVESRGMVRQKGSVLILVMVLTAVSALTIAALRTRLENNQQAESLRAVKLEYKGILESLKLMVEGQGFCNTPSTGMLDGSVKLAGTSFNKVLGPKALKFSHNGVALKLQKGWRNSRENLKILDLRLEYIDQWKIKSGANKWKRANVPVHTFATSKVASLRAKYYLIIEAVICRDQACSPSKALYLTNKRNATGNKLSLYAIDIIVDIRFQAKKTKKEVRLKNKGLAVTCFGPSSGAAQCEDMGGIWNPFVANAKYRCEPHKKCHERAAELFLSGANKGKFKKCEYSPPYEKTLVGFKYVKAGKKTGVPKKTPKLDSAAKKTATFSCLWCNTNKDL